MQTAPNFPVVRWGDLTVSFHATALPLDANVAAVVVFAIHDGRFVLADIPDRGWCVPSGRLEVAERPLDAAIRETSEEVGGELTGAELIGYYTLANDNGEVSYVPTYVGQIADVGAIPSDSESRGVRLAALDELTDCYWMWDPLIEAVFRYAYETCAGHV